MFPIWRLTLSLLIPFSTLAKRLARFIAGLGMTHFEFEQSSQTDTSGDSFTIGEAWGDCLPESHSKALYATLCDLVDEFLDDIGDDENFSISELRQKYRLHYNGLFRHKFLVTLLTVGYKLALPNPLSIEDAGGEFRIARPAGTKA